MRHSGSWRLTPLVHIAAAMLIVITAAATAAAVQQSRCRAAEIRCVWKEADALLGCEQRAETPGRPPDPSAGRCVEKAKARLGRCLLTLGLGQSPDCAGLPDAAAVAALADSCVAEIVASIDSAPADQTRCNAGKVKCAAKKLKGLLKCYETASTPGHDDDPDTGGCLDRTRAKFDGGPDPARGCFVQLESRPGNDCQAPLGNTAAVEAVVETACVETIVVTSTTTTTSRTTISFTIPTTTSTTHTTTTTTTLPERCGPSGSTGVKVGGYCWYLSPSDCASLCAESGLDYDPATATFAGSEGSDANCREVSGTWFRASVVRFEGHLDDCTGLGGGLGCVGHLASSGGWSLPTFHVQRCIAPPTMGDASPAPGYFRFCACQ